MKFYPKYFNAIVQVIKRQNDICSVSNTNHWDTEKSDGKGQPL